MRVLEGAERKLATMVFADLVGSTQLAAGLDPEVLRGRLEPFFDVARASLEEHGGTLEKYIGDAVMAVFGVPRAHGDDPDRAIAAALALVERMAELDSGLAVRIGIEAGEVLVTDPRGDLSVTGEPVNAAVRLQQAAEPGEILVGERAARACRQARLERRRPVDAKGLPEPLTAWRAIATGAEVEEPDVPLLGRDDELELLRIVYRRAVKERAPQLVTITGEAGIGKTRLAGELMSQLACESESPRILLGRSPAYGHGIAFWAMGEILRELSESEPEDPVGKVRERLETELSRLGAEDADRIASSLTIALGGSNGAGHGDAEDELKRAWRRLVALLAADRPLVIGIDDAHFADDGLLELIEEIAFGLQDAPLLVLCTSRPELYERRPDFGRSARNVSQIELRPLDSASATELVEMLLPDQARRIAPRVARASGGNPFFAEEVARSITDRAGSAGIDVLPDTVHAAITARIDLLPAEEKRVLQHASVLGPGFHGDALAQLMAGSPAAALAALERRALVQERITDGPGRYTFRHHLIRDVVYGTLPRRDRAALHERAAEGIRAAAGERHMELAELIAYHLTQAADLDRTAARREAAHEATLEAAEIAQRRGGAASSQRLYEQAATLAPSDAGRVEAMRAAAEVAIRRMRGDQGLRLLRAAAEAAEHAGENRPAAAAHARAVEVVTRMGGVTGDLAEEEMVGMLSRARKLVPDDDIGTRALLRLDDAWMAWRFEREEEMGPPAREGLELARRSGDARLISSGLDALAASEWNANRYDLSLQHSLERLDLLADAPPSPGREVERTDTLHMVIESLMQTGELREAARYASQSRELDLSHGIVYAAWVRSLLPAFFLGEWDEALRMSRFARDAWVAEERPPLSAMATSMSSAAAIYGYRGDEEASEEWFGVAEGMARSSHQAAGIRFLRADVALHHDRRDDAARLLASPEPGFWWKAPYLAARAEAFVLAASDDAEEALALAEAPTMRQPYARATLLRAQGQRTGEEAPVREALEIFREMGCPYQLARTGWLLDADARSESEEIFERLRVPPPASEARVSSESRARSRAGA
jgi:class 3 adenylate cyclase